MERKDIADLRRCLAAAADDLVGDLKDLESFLDTLDVEPYDIEITIRPTRPKVKSQTIFFQSPDRRLLSRIRFIIAERKQELTKALEEL